MKLTVLGATGATGRLVVAQALDRGHEVTVLARNPAHLVIAPRMRIVPGDATDATSVVTAINGADAVISVLGRGLATTATSLIFDGTRALLAAAAHTGINRIVLMSSFGVGDSQSKASWLAQILYRGPARHVYADKAKGEVLLRTSSLAWTLVYPVMLTNQAPARSVHSSDLTALSKMPGLLPRISRASVAEFLLQTAENGTWLRKTVALY